MTNVVINDTVQVYPTADKGAWFAAVTEDYIGHGATVEEALMDLAYKYSDDPGSIEFANIEKDFEELVGFVACEWEDGAVQGALDEDALEAGQHYADARAILESSTHDTLCDIVSAFNQRLTS